MPGHLQRTPPTRNFPKGGWEARWLEEVNGRQRWRGKTFATKKDAERHLAKVITDIDRGEHIGSHDSERRFGELAEVWASTLSADLSPKTVGGYLSTLRVHVMPRWQGQRLATITHDQVQQWINDMLRVGRSAAQVVKGYRVLRMILGYAVDAGWIRANPCARKLRVPRVRSREMRHLTSEQVEALASAFVERKPVRKYDSRTRSRDDFALYVRFAAYTGLRAGEICALRVKALDLSTGQVHVRESVSVVSGILITRVPKTEAGLRTVAVPARMIPELRQYLGSRIGNPDAYVFVGEQGGPFRHGNFYGRFWKPALAAAGLPVDLRFHDLRHTYASLLVRAGVHVKVMSTLMGHSTAQITLDRYSHMWPGTELQVAALVDALITDQRPE